MCNQVKSLEEFKKDVVANTFISQDVDIIIDYMKASQKLISDQLGQTELVKLATTASSNVITDVEKGQYDIKRTIGLLETDLEELSANRDEKHRLAKLCLKEGKRATVHNYKLLLR